MLIHTTLLLLYLVQLVWLIFQRKRSWESEELGRINNFIPRYLLFIYKYICKKKKKKSGPVKNFRTSNKNRWNGYGRWGRGQVWPRYSELLQSLITCRADQPRDLQRLDSLTQKRARWWNGDRLMGWKKGHQRAWKGGPKMEGEEEERGRQKCIFKGK